MHKHTKETKEKLSKIRSEQIANGIHGGFNDVPWLKIKNLKGEEYSVRGKWEYWTAEYLNKRNINWSRNRFLSYVLTDNICRIYNPDFYLNDLDTYVEVKGYFSKKDKEKIESVLRQNDIKLLWINDKNIKQIKSNSIKLEDIPFYNPCLFNVEDESKLKNAKKLYHYCCEQCNKVIDCTRKIRTKHIFCCNLCYKKYKQEHSRIPSKDVLLKDFKDFVSITKIANNYNVSGNTVRKWCIKYEIDYKKAIRDSKILIEYNGKQYAVSELSKILNISEKTLYNRYKNNKIENIKKVEARRYELEGHFYTIRELSKVKGIPVTTIRHRLDRGMSIIEALNK